MPAHIHVPAQPGLGSLATLSPTEPVVPPSNHRFFKVIPFEPLARVGTSREDDIGLSCTGVRPSIPIRSMDLSRVMKGLSRVSFRVQQQAMDEEPKLHTSEFSVAGSRIRAHREIRAQRTKPA